MRLETRSLDVGRQLPAGLVPNSGRQAIALFAGCPELIGSPFQYDRDEEIYGEAEEAEFVYRIMSGAVRSCKMMSDGRRQINSFHISGDLFGFETGALHRLTVEAVIGTKVLMFRRQHLERIAARDVDVACQLWNLAAKNLRQAEEHMLLLGRCTALERVAAFMLDFDTRLGASGAIELPMSRRDIADYLGLTLETVSRSMSQLQSDHALTLSGARHVVLNKGLMHRIVEA